MSKPKISVNKLGEYINANAARRKRIVEQQKEPSAFIVSRYSAARDAIARYIISKYDKNIILEAISDISTKENTSEFQINDSATSIEALKQALEFELPNLENFELYKFEGNGKMDILGVDVSIMPDVVFKGIVRKKNIVGAIKIHIAKTSPLDLESRKNVATLLHQFVEERLSGALEKADHKYCFSIDIFAAKVENAPTTFITRRTHINASCEEYAMWWDKL